MDIAENKSKIKYKINFKDVLAVIIMLIILFVCGFLLFNFFQHNSYLFKDETTTTTRGIFKTTTKTTTKSLVTVRTTDIKTKATHEVYDPEGHTNRPNGNTVTTSRINFTTPTTTIRTNKVTTTQPTTSTVPVIDDDENQDDVNNDDNQDNVDDDGQTEE